MLQDPDEVGGQASIGLASEVGHVHTEAATWLQGPDALLEHLGEHVEVLEVGRGDAIALELLLVGLAGEVGR